VAESESERRSEVQQAVVFFSRSSIIDIGGGAAAARAVRALGYEWAPGFLTQLVRGVGWFSLAREN
jgi:ribose 5-phosphate isomerase